MENSWRNAEQLLAEEAGEAGDWGPEVGGETKRTTRLFVLVE
jgi:hypothetical protein